MTRKVFIERHIRQLYNGFPTDDATIDNDLVNVWLSDAIGIAAKKNYTDNFQLEGVGFNNNSFYSKFKGIAITADERFLWKATLPEIPLGVGSTEGISSVVFKDLRSTVSYPCVLLSENQVAIQRQMRPIPNKILGYPEGGYLYIISSILMNNYTATVTMISGGDATDLDSILNVPSDYFPVMVQYIQQQLMIERKAVPDFQNDGKDN